VGAVRGLYFFAAAMFTIKAAVTFLATKETAQGRVRRAETRGASLLSILGGYGGVARTILGSPRILSVGALMLVISITQTISGTFLAILATRKLGIPAARLAIFPFAKAAVVIGIFFLAAKALARLRYEVPLVAGFGLYAASQVLYVLAPPGGYTFLIAGTALEAICFAVANPMVDRLLAVSVDPAERARIQGLLYVGVIILSAPFGWIAGSLSQVDEALPMVLNAALFCSGTAAARFAGRRADAAASV